MDDHIKDGEIQPEAQSIVNAMDSYTEYSQSGTGLHIFIKAKKSGKRSKNSTKGIEIYDSERFIVMTGDHVDGTPTEIHERQDILSYIYDSYFPASKTQEIKPSKLDLSPKLSDEDVLNIGFKAKTVKNSRVFIRVIGVITAVKVKRIKRYAI